MKPTKFMAALGLFWAFLFPGVIVCILICLAMVYRDFSITYSDYAPYVMKVDAYESGGTYSNTPHFFVGSIKEEEKSLYVSDSLFDLHPAYVYVFSTKGNHKVFLRSSTELILDKTPYRRQALTNLLIALLVFPIWYLVNKYITNLLKKL